MKNINLKKYFLSFLFVDIFVIIFGLFFKDKNFLISSQVGFISSVLVIISSFYGYKKMIEQKIEQGDIPVEIEDELDKIDDKYELYQKEENIQKIIELERQNNKGLKKSLQNLQKNFFGAISPFRLLSYLFLILSFLYLNAHHLLNIFGYILGISIVSIVVLGMSVIL